MLTSDCVVDKPSDLAQESHYNPNSASVKAQAGGVSGSASSCVSDAAGGSSHGGTSAGGSGGDAPAAQQLMYINQWTERVQQPLVSSGASGSMHVSASDGFIPGSVRSQWRLFGFSATRDVPDIHVCTVAPLCTKVMRKCPGGRAWLGTGQPWLMTSRKNAKCHCNHCGNTRSRSRYLAWHEQACWQWLLEQGVLQVTD